MHSAKIPQALVVAQKTIGIGMRNLTKLVKGKHLMMMPSSTRIVYTTLAKLENN
jgi:hypothetical protein